MIPPFSAMANVSGRMADTAFRHIASALARLADGGRLWRSPARASGRTYRPARRLRPAARARPHRVHGHDRRRGLRQARHHDRHAADRHRQGARREPGGAAGIAGHGARRCDLAGLDRGACPEPPAARDNPRHPDAGCRAPRTVRGYLARAAIARPSKPSVVDLEAVDLAYETIDWTPPEGARSAMRSMRNTGSNRSGFRAPKRTRPSWCSPPPWPRSRRQNRAIGRACRSISSATRSSPTPSSRRVVYAGEAHGDYLAGAGPWTRPSISSPPRATMRRTPSAFAGASCWATAPAPARAASRPASFSTTG